MVKYHESHCEGFFHMFQAASQPDAVLSVSVSVIWSTEKVTRKENKMRRVAFIEEKWSMFCQPIHASAIL